MLSSTPTHRSEDRDPQSSRASRRISMAMADLLATKATTNPVANSETEFEAPEFGTTLPLTQTMITT